MSDQTTSETPSTKQPTWLGHLFSPQKGRNRGDIIAANVGEGAHGVVVGKNVVQIGTLTIPLVPVLLTLFLLIAAAALAAWLYYTPTEMNLGNFNIAVAQFGEPDEDGKLQPSDIGAELSKVVYDGLYNAFNVLSTSDQGDKPVIWHDSMFPFEIRTRLGIVSNETEAKELARRINASLVIYGRVENDGYETLFSPAFYAPVLAEGEEFISGEVLGKSISLDREMVVAKQEIKSRIEKLWLFARGLQDDFNNKPVSAMKFFSDTIALMESEGGIQSHAKGKEVLYYFIGREALLANSLPENVANSDPKTIANNEQVALAAFSQALEINPDYARAHIGLGNLNVQAAERTAADPEAATRILDDAIANYEKALELDAQAPQAFLKSKAHLCLSNAYRLKAGTHRARDQLEETNEVLDLAINEAYSALTEIEEEASACYTCRALAFYDVGAAYHDKAYLYSCTYGDLMDGLGYYEDALDSYIQCDESVKQQLQITSSSYLVDLGRNLCAESATCTSTCLKKLQEGENACHIEECANRCLRTTDPNP